VFANHNLIPDAESTTLLSAEDGARFKLIAGVLSHCLDVFGSDKKALYWLHQPVSRFERHSPLQFLEATWNVQKVDEYLTQIEEGNFA
jgi:putative toxin-antitoxin system antitoxin component (TIGR02293 family)